MNNDSIGVAITAAGVAVALIAGLGMIPMISAVAGYEPLPWRSGTRLRVLGTFGIGVTLYLLGQIVRYQS